MDPNTVSLAYLRADLIRASHSLTPEERATIASLVADAARDWWE